MNPQEPDYRHAVDPNPGAVPIGEVAESPNAAPDRPARARSHPGRIIGGIVALLLLVALIVFVSQNNGSVPIAFLGFTGSMPLGVSMVIAALAGMLIVGLLSLTIRLRRRHNRKG